MNNSTDRRPTIDEWISQYTQLTNRYPSGGEIEDAIYQGVVRNEGQFNMGFAPSIPPPAMTSSSRKAFSTVALLSLLVAFVSLWLPVATFFGETIGWFEFGFAGEGAFLLLATILSALFISVHLVKRNKGWKVTAGVVSIVSGIFLTYDGLVNLSNLGEWAGPGLLPMGLAGIGLTVGAIGLLVAE